MSSQKFTSNTKLATFMAPIGVLLVDDQLAVREGLARLIASAPLALYVVGRAATGAEALSVAARLRPEVVVLDVDLAGEDGLALIPQLALSASVLVLSSHGDPATRARAARLGAQAFIEKHQPAAELLGSIFNIARLQRRGEKAPEEQDASAHPTWPRPPL
jgi:two-component system nitrate/nitrite response regulator NarL